MITGRSSQRYPTSVVRVEVCPASRAISAVYRVSSAKAGDLRRFLRRHAKSNGLAGPDPIGLNKGIWRTSKCGGGGTPMNPD